MFCPLTFISRRSSRAVLQVPYHRWKWCCIASSQSGRVFCKQVIFMPVSDTYPRQWIMMPKETYLAHPANDLYPCPTSSSFSCQVVSPGRLLFLLTWGSLLAPNTWSNIRRQSIISSGSAAAPPEDERHSCLLLSIPCRLKTCFLVLHPHEPSFPSRCGLVFEFCVRWSCQDPKVG